MSERDSASGRERDLAAELRLRPERPAVTRLSRKVLIGLAAAAACTIAGALIFGLSHGRRQPNGGPELYNTANKPTPEGFANLPRDYSGVVQTKPPAAALGIPPLGPPLPGDLGRAIRNTQLAATPSGEPAVDAEQQRLAQESEAARVSRVFAPTSARERPAAPGVQSVTMGDDGNAVLFARRIEGPAFDHDSNMQDRKLAFLTAPVDRKTVSRDRLTYPPSRYVVQAGAVIPAALITGIRSDLPGQVTAQVTEHVYDSPTGKYLLIPQGAKLIGVYDSQISFGQNRVLLVWTRLILPNGHSIVLERERGADAQGFAGLEDEVDHHWKRLFMAAALSTLLGVGAELGGAGDDSAILAALRRGGADSLNQTGQLVVRRNLTIQPTLTIRPGFPVRVLVTRDLVLAPYPS